MIFQKGLMSYCIKSLPVIVPWRNTQRLGWLNLWKMPLIQKLHSRSIAPFRKNTKKVNAKDKVSDDYSLIYHAPLGNYTLFAQCFGLFSSVSMTVSTYFAVYSDKKIEPMKIGGLDFVTGTDDLIMFSILSVFLACSVIIVSRKCTLRIYHNALKNDYIAVFPSIVPFRTSKVNFDKAVKSNSFSFLYKNVSYKLGSREAYLLDYYFKCPMDLTEMLGDMSK